MKNTLTFTKDHENELKRISTLNIFASKIAQTILSSDIYKASAKQVDILNTISDIIFYISNDYADRYEIDARKWTNYNLPSSMR